MVRKIFLFALLLVAMGCAGMENASTSGEVPRMTKEELKARLSAPNLVIVDVRTAADWSAERNKIAGAVREIPADFEQWAEKYPKEKTLVLYCA